MASFHRCDQCGEPMAGDERVHVSVKAHGSGSVDMMSMYSQIVMGGFGGGPTQQARALVNGEFEFCKTCGTALALALNAAKLRVKLANGPVKRDLA